MAADDYKFAIKAMQCLEAGEYSEAVSICEQGLAQYPDYPCAISVLALAYYSLNEVVTAKIVIDAAYNRYPLNMSVLAAKSKIYAEQLSPSEQGAVIEEEVNNHDSEEEFTYDGAISDYSHENKDANRYEYEDKDEDEEDFDEDIYDFTKQLETVKNLTDKLKNIDAEENLQIYTQTDYSADTEEINTNTKTMDNIMENIENFVQEDNIEDDGVILERVDEETYFPDHIMQDSIIVDITESGGAVDTDIDSDTDADINNININTNVDVDAHETEYAKDAKDIDYTENNLESSEIDSGENFLEEWQLEDKESTFEFPYEHATYNNIAPVGALYQRDLDFNSINKNMMESPHIEVSHLLTDVYVSDKLQKVFSCKSESIKFDEFYISKKDNVDDTLTKSNITDSKVLEFLELSKKLEGAKISPVLEIEERDEDDAPLVASETMAKLFTKQKRYQKAIDVYNLLIEEKPEKADYYQEQINNLKK